MKTYFVEDYGILPNSGKIVSAELQSLIDLCGKEGGGSIVFSEGAYILSTVFLKSGVCIELCKGAIIYGAESFYDYAPEEKIDFPIYQDSSHTYFHCSMFVGVGCKNIAFRGEGIIDMRSVWDEDNVRDIVHRGPKCIALKECENVEIRGITVLNATDLAVYFAGCRNVDIGFVKMRVYIDGISPDNSKNVRIHDCDLETGDDGIVFKSTYNLNRIDYCDDIKVWNCRLKSRCNAVKIGTETIGFFRNIFIENIHIYETRMAGIAIESEDGAIIDGVTVKNVTMKNAGAPFFMHIGNRMSGPEGRTTGRIENIVLQDISVDGPYVPYNTIAWNYESFVCRDTEQSPWMISGNICGLSESPIRNLTLRNIKIVMHGGVSEFKRDVPEKTDAYPEVNMYGRILPAKGIYFRYVDGLCLDNVKTETYFDDARDEFIFDAVKNLVII